MERIEVNNKLVGYTDHDKLNYVYRDLRSEILTTDPVQTSPRGLVVIKEMSGHRIGSYHWELYENGVMLEAWGEWKGYAPGPIIPPEMEKDRLNFLRITIPSDTLEIKSRIEEIVSRYPEDSKKKVG